MPVDRPEDARPSPEASLDDARPRMEAISSRSSLAGDVATPGLPVAVTGPRHVVTQVAAFVEASLGWQVTDGDHLPPRVRLAAVTIGAPSRDPAPETTESDRVPTVVLVGPDDPPVAVAHQARRADAVLAWPADHDRLERVVAGVVDGVVDRGAPDRAPLVVAGSAGGVGTTTVALAIAGWIAWDGGRALAVVSGRAPVPDVARISPGVLAGHRGWPAATPVPDVPGLRVVSTTGVVERIDVPTGVRVVVDRGVVWESATGPALAGDPTDAARAVDVVVVRRDRAGCATVEDCPGAVVVAVDRGPRALRELADAAAGRPLLVVPDSARAVRAHDRGRVPGSLPRTMLDPLRALAEPASSTLP